MSNAGPVQQQQDQRPAYERSPITSSLVEVVDRVLDKGVVIDAWAKVSLVGIEVLTIEARVVVASVETYIRYAELLAGTRRIGGGREEGRQALGESMKKQETQDKQSKEVQGEEGGGSKVNA